MKRERLTQRMMRQVWFMPNCQSESLLSLSLSLSHSLSQRFSPMKIDISSAFVARASKKNCQQTSQSGASGDDCMKNKRTVSHKTNEEKENVDPGFGGKMNGASGGPADVVRINGNMPESKFVISVSLPSSLSLLFSPPLSFSRPQQRRWPAVVSWLDWVT